MNTKNLKATQIALFLYLLLSCFLTWIHRLLLFKTGVFWIYGWSCKEQLKKKKLNGCKPPLSSRDFLQTTSYSNNQTRNKNLTDLILHYTCSQSLVNHLLITDLQLRKYCLTHDANTHLSTSFIKNGKQNTCVSPIINLLFRHNCF